MADVTIKYKGSQIAELNEKGSKTLKTAGTYCEGDIGVTYTPNSRTYIITPAKASNWVLLTTLDTDVLEHINDENFTVTLQSLSAYSYVSYLVTIAMATNKQQGNATSSNYPSYGVAIRNTSENGITSLYAYYPPNKTDDERGLSGVIFRVTDGKYYIRPGDGYVGGVTYKLTFTW